MSEINNTFAEFNTLYPNLQNQSFQTQNQTVSSPQSQTASKQQIQGSLDKKKFEPKDLFIPAAATATGGVGGIIATQIYKNTNIKNYETQIKKYRGILLRQFNENPDVIIINNNLDGAKKLLETLENSIKTAENLISKEKSPTKIARLKEGLNRTIQAKERQESNLNNLNISLKEKYASLIEKPLKEYGDTLKSKLARQNASFAKKVAAIGAAAGAIIGTGITFYVKNKQKEKSQ